MTNKHDDTPRVLSLIESRALLSRLRVASKQETLQLSPSQLKVGRSSPKAWAASSSSISYIYAPRHGGDDFTFLRFDTDGSHTRHLVTCSDTPELHALLCSLWEVSRLRYGETHRRLRLIVDNH